MPGRTQDLLAVVAQLLVGQSGLAEAGQEGGLLPDRSRLQCLQLLPDFIGDFQELAALRGQVVAPVLPEVADDAATDGLPDEVVRILSLRLKGGGFEDL